jgi:hypothetical protein
MGTGVEIALIGLALGSTVASIDASKTAARRQKRASELRQNTQLGQDRDVRTQGIREQRIRRARILQAGENTGTTGSSQESGVLGGMSTVFSQSVGSQASQKLSNIAIGNQMQGAADAASRANTFQAISNLAVQGASFSAANPTAPKKTP